MTEPMTYAQAKEEMARAARAIRNAEGACKVASDNLATAEALYRQAFAKRVAELRTAGESATAAEARTRGEVAALSRERDQASGALKLAYEVLENRRGERQSLHRLVDWSSGLDLAAKARAS
jgi:conjugal transfer/entry exclusion protein